MLRARIVNSFPQVQRQEMVCKNYLQSLHRVSNILALAIKKYIRFIN